MPLLIKRKALTNLVLVGQSETEVVTTGDAEGWERLGANRRVRSLTVYDLRDENLSLLRDLKSLKQLEIVGTKVHALDAIGFLSRLRTLEIVCASKVQSFKFLSRLNQLQRLVIRDAPHLESIAFVQKLSSLRDLEISSMVPWRDMCIGTLNPLRAATRLKRLIVLGEIADRSLAPLQELKQLTELHVPLDLPLEEYAAVSVGSKRQKPLFAAPFWESKATCPRCREAREIFTLGLQRNIRCPQCDQGRLVRFVAEYDTLKQQLRNTHKAKAKRLARTN